MNPYSAGPSTSENTRLVGYLTPYKIAMMNLIMVYCEGVIPWESKIIVMSGVIEFIDSIDGRIDGSELKALDHTLNSVRDSLTGIGSGNDANGIYNLLLSRLWKLESLDDLHSFFQQVVKYIKKPANSEEEDNDDDEDEDEDEDGFIDIHKVKPASILGSFLRKCYLSFDQLSFDQVSELWQSFTVFRSPSRQEWDVIKHELGDDSEQETDHMEALRHVEVMILTPAMGNRCISTEDFDHLLEVEAEKIEKNGAILPEKIRRLLEALVSSDEGGLPSSAYFVQYLDACKNLDYERAFEHLHRFYDYTMDSRGRTHYQYALFTLAVLQSQYQGSREALKAAQEAISVARENMDLVCLTQILSWIHDYLANNPRVEIPESLAIKEQIAQYLKTKSGEWSTELQSRAYQSEVGELMSKGEGLTAAFEALTKSFHIHLSSADISSTTTQLNLVQSALWDRCGVRSLAQVYTDFCSADENAMLLLHVNIRKAQALFSMGEMADAFVIMESLEALVSGSPLYLQLWLPAMLLMRLQQSLNQDKLVQARLLVKRMCGYEWEDANIKEEIRLAKIWLEYLSNNLTSALSMASEWLHDALRFEVDIVFRVRYILLYARILMASSQPERALSMVLKVLGVAHKASLHRLTLETVVILATILNSKGLSQDALTILDSNMPAILESGSIELVAEAYEALSDASIGVSSQSSHSLSSGWKYIVQAGRCYEKSGNLKKLRQISSKQLSLAQSNSSLCTRAASIKESIEQTIRRNARECLVE